MVFDTSFLNTQHYKVRIKGTVKQSRGRSGTLPDTYWKGAFGSSSTKRETTLLTYILLNNKLKISTSLESKMKG